MNIFHVLKTPSTNTLLREWTTQNPLAKEITIYATEQTSGRGQRDNYWEAEAGKNLTCSILLSPKNLTVNQQFILSQIVSIAISNVLLEEQIGDISIKWPNDIYYKDKKIAGILIENDLEGQYILRSIIGIGLNINQKEFRSNAPNPISMLQITGKTFSIEDILNKILDHIDSLYQQAENNPQAHHYIKEKYMSLLYRRNGYYPFSNGNETFDAQIADVLPNGLISLKVRGESNTRLYAFKEISFL